MILTDAALITVGLDALKKVQRDLEKTKQLVGWGTISGVITLRFSVMLERNSFVKLNASAAGLIMEPPDKKAARRRFLRKS
jgi:hypothetical protein